MAMMSPRKAGRDRVRYRILNLRGTYKVEEQRPGTASSAQQVRDDHIPQLDQQREVEKKDSNKGLKGLMKRFGFPAPRAVGAGKTPT